MNLSDQNCSYSTGIMNATYLTTNGLLLFSSIKILIICVEFIGIPINLFVFYILLHVKLGSRLTTLLLSNQCVFDCLICIFALVKEVKPGRWYTGYIIFDSILCHLWFSYTLFWFGVLLSLSNMISTAFDRLGAVVYSQTYQTRQNLYIIFAYTGIIIYSLVLISINPLLLQYRDNKCYDTIVYDHTWLFILIQIDSVLWPFLTYLLPCIINITIYCKVIMMLKCSRLNYLKNNNPIQIINKPVKNFNKNRRKSQIAQSLTIATSTIQTIFLITHAYDRIYYFLGINQWISYEVGCAKHLIGLWLVTLNSFINPITLIFTVRPIQFYILQMIKHFCIIYTHDEPIDQLPDHSDTGISRTEYGGDLKKSNFHNSNSNNKNNDNNKINIYDEMIEDNNENFVIK